MLNEKKCVTILQRRIKFSGICGGCSSDDFISTTRKDSQTAEGVQTCQQSGTSNRQAVSSPYRHDDILHSGSITSPTTLQGPSEIETGGSGTLPGRLRPCNSIVSSGTMGFRMVDNASPLLNVSQPILPVPQVMSLETDASKIGWGAVCRNTKIATGGPWPKGESTAHINWS